MNKIELLQLQAFENNVWLWISPWFIVKKRTQQADERDISSDRERATLGKRKKRWKSSAKLRQKPRQKTVERGVFLAQGGDFPDGM